MCEDRKNATVRERQAWQHDIGQHKNAEFPFMYCAQCELTHPLGRFEQLRRAVEVIALEGRNLLPDATDDQAGVIETWASALLLTGRPPDRELSDGS